jgi:hypothetical protein
VVPLDQKDAKLQMVLSLAERRRAARGSELTQDDIVDIGNELDIPERDVLRAMAHVDALRTSEALTVSSTPDELWLTSKPVGSRWPLVARMGVAAGMTFFVAGWILRVSHQSALMAAAGVPVVAVAIWYLYRCLSLGTERVSLVLGKASHLQIQGLPLVGRDIAFRLAEFDITRPEVADDEEGGLRFLPMHWLPVRIKGKVTNICAGHSKRELTSAYEAISAWLNAKRQSGDE